MNAEISIKLNKFIYRWYQLPILDAIINKGYKRVIAILPRRAGKDIAALNMAIRMLIERPQTIYYIFPTYAQARKVIWQGINNDGMHFLDYIPPEVIEGKNGQEMVIRFKNGSILSFIGSDNYNALMGTNPSGIIFSEYALQDERAYPFLRPILTANGGWALFISTPRGKNHLYTLYEIAKNSDDWFCYKMGVDDTRHISLYEIDKERAEGIMSEDLIQQEYYCSFDMGVEGGFYTKYFDKMRLKNQITQVPWEPGFKVNTAWDIGVRDSTAIIFFQCIGATVRIIDYYEKNKEGLEHYVGVLESKPYSYGKHIAPHDIRVREFGSGITRIEKARQLGIRFTIAEDIGIMDGIEAARSTLSKVWIDEQKCAALIKALENYRQEYDSKRGIYKSTPLHDKNSHAADCFRYLAVSLPKTRDGSSPEELERRYEEALFGENRGLPPVFRDEFKGF